MPEEKIFYLTKEGLQRIKKEHQDLEELKLAKTKGESPKVIYSDELNPEYTAFQEDLGFLESRLSELEHILKNSQLIKPPSKEKQKTIQLGATVLVSVDDQNDEFTIVGHLEANPSIGRISNESPVGQALLGHRMGDKVVISSPVKTTYKIKKIRYEGSS
ncbi:Transcription elongation factor GreA [subsurface metagenome]